MKGRIEKKKKEKKDEEKRKKAEAEAEAKKKEEDARKTKEAEDFRAQLPSESDPRAVVPSAGKSFRGTLLQCTGRVPAHARATSQGVPSIIAISLLA